MQMSKALCGSIIAQIVFAEILRCFDLLHQADRHPHRAVCKGALDHCRRRVGWKGFVAERLCGTAAANPARMLSYAVCCCCCCCCCCMCWRYHSAIWPCRLNQDGKRRNNMAMCWTPIQVHSDAPARVVRNASGEARLCLDKQHALLAQLARRTRCKWLAMLADPAATALCDLVAYSAAMPQ